MTAVAEPAPDAEDADHLAEVHEHPKESQYWMVALVLAVLTALETSTYWWPDDWSKVARVSLIVMMTIKFAMVAAYFMHLKFDPKLLRRMFTFGIVLAITCYVVLLSTMLFWNDSGTRDFPDPPRSESIPPPVDQSAS